MFVERDAICVEMEANEKDVGVSEAKTNNDKQKSHTK